MNEKNWLRENGDKLLALAAFVVLVLMVIFAAHMHLDKMLEWAERLADQSFAAFTTLLTAGVAAAKIAQAMKKDDPK